MAHELITYCMGLSFYFVVADVTRVIRRRYDSHIKNGKKKPGGGSKKKKAKDDDDAAFSPLSEGGDEPLDVDDEEDDEYVEGEESGDNRSSRAAKRDNRSSRAAKPKRTKHTHNRKSPPTRRDSNKSTTPSEEKRPSIIIGSDSSSNQSVGNGRGYDNRPTIRGSGSTSNRTTGTGTSVDNGRGNDSRLSSNNQSSNNQEPSTAQLITSLVSEVRKVFSGKSNPTEPKITPPDNPDGFKYLPIPVGTESSDGRTTDKDSYYNFETNQIEMVQPSFDEIRKKLPVTAAHNKQRWEGWCIR